MKKGELSKMETEVDEGREEEAESYAIKQVYMKGEVDRGEERNIAV